MKLQRFQHYSVDLPDFQHSVPNVAYLTKALWPAFIEFYELFLVERRVGSVSEPILPSRFREASFAYFDEILATPKNADSPPLVMADLYFENFSAIGSMAAHRNRMLWMTVYRLVREWETERKHALHKGTLFYNWATESLLAGDIINAVVLLHRSHEEDRQHYGDATIATPAYDFLTLRLKTSDALYPMTLEMTRFVLDAIDGYREQTGHALRFRDVQEHFFGAQGAEIDDLKFYFLFSVLRCLKLQTIFETGGLADEKVAPMVFSIMLANLLSVVETLQRLGLLADPATKPSHTFINYMTILAVRYRWTTDDKHYHAEIRNAHLTRENFETIVCSLLDGTYRTRRGRMLEPLERDMVLAYQLRNSVAHSLQSQHVLWREFPRVLQSVMNCFLLGVELLKGTPAAASREPMARAPEPSKRPKFCRLAAHVLQNLQS